MKHLKIFETRNTDDDYEFKSDLKNLITKYLKHSWLEIKDIKSLMQEVGKEIKTGNHPFEKDENGSYLK